jgi:adenine phosphoribosyltransferase
LICPGSPIVEGHDWKAVLGADAGLVRGLGHIPVFRIENGQATPIPEMA